MTHKCKRKNIFWWVYFWLTPGLTSRLTLLWTWTLPPYHVPASLKAYGVINNNISINLFTYTYALYSKCDPQPPPPEKFNDKTGNPWLDRERYSRGVSRGRGRVASSKSTTAAWTSSKTCNTHTKTKHDLSGSVHLTSALHVWVLYKYLFFYIYKCSLS